MHDADDGAGSGPAVTDIGRLCGAGRARITELVSGLDPAAATRSVPACPEWRVCDVIAHLAGSCADVLAGRIDGITTARWADAQVAARQGRTIAELLEEWATLAPPLEANPERMPDPLPTVWLIDLTTHEHDVRGALSRPGARTEPALDLVVDFLAAGLGTQVTGRGLAPLEVRAGRRRWALGGTDEAPVTLDIGIFDLLRALTGRRSREQIAGYDWSADPTPYLPCFEFGTFTTRATDLDE